MECPRCGMTNREGARFCNHCGTFLLGGRLPTSLILHQRYRIVSLLAQGGMGRVYLAEDIRLFSRRIALKEMIVLTGTPGEQSEAIRRFEQEARLLVHLSHPNLPQIFDYFSENGRHYLAMEFIDGMTLENVLDTTPRFLPVGRVIAWAIQVCEVLQYLHTRQPPIIFRDLKPSNIMLTGDKQIKLIDFGIARVFKPTRGADTVALGTPGYAPPEQYGRGQTDARSDIYALGVTIHHLLTGYEPFSFTLPPCQTLNPAIPKTLADVISKATQISPAERFQSAEEMVVALRTAMNSAVIPKPAVKPAPDHKPPKEPVRPATTGRFITPSSDLSGRWEVPVSTNVLNAMREVLQDERKPIAQQIAMGICDTGVHATTRSVVLRGMEGCGGTTLVNMVCQEIIGKPNILVVSLSLSNKREIDIQATYLQELLMAFKSVSGSLDENMQKAIYDVQRRYNDAQQPRKIVSEVNRKIDFFPIGIEGSTPFLKASLKSPYSSEGKVQETTENLGLEGDDLTKRLLIMMKDLVGYLTVRGACIVIVLDKVRDINNLNPLLSLLDRSGVYTIVVANLDDYHGWRKDDPTLLACFDKAPGQGYIPCVWNLHDTLLRHLLKGNPPVIDTKEGQAFLRFLAYRSRGLPSPLKDQLGRFVRRGKRRIPVDWLKDVNTLVVESTEWSEIRPVVRVQRALETGWPDIFNDPAHGIPALEDLPRENQDRARMGIYILTDWLLMQANEATFVSASDLIEHVTATCDLPFNESAIRHICTRFVNYSVKEGLLQPRKQRGKTTLILSGLQELKY